VIRCLGFKFDKSIFKSVNNSPESTNRKYPHISATYESVEHGNMFFAGTISHSLDFRRSSGGFIHGFRYNGTEYEIYYYWDKCYFAYFSGFVAKKKFPKNQLVLFSHNIFWENKFGFCRTKKLGL